MCRKKKSIDIYNKNRYHKTVSEAVSVIGTVNQTPTKEELL